ncbi:MAG: S41 family peptidase, partial [Mycobacteriales bacterium]
DPAGQAVQKARQQLYAPGKVTAPWLETSRPAIFSARPLSARHGYLRIWSFADTDDAGVLAEAARLVSLLPRGGIVIDIRGNPGGNVPTAERLLQLFTTEQISPAGFSLADTDVTLAMSRADPHELGRWTNSLQAAVSTGEPYSQAFPLTTSEAVNDLPAEQRYPGAATLIVDPLTYSAADIFAAGFQDNDIGPVLGTARTTGAGGANVWTGAQIAERTGDLDAWPALPASGAAFTVAIRRATRVGGRAGLPLEDIGVAVDEVHEPTLADLTHGNRDLLRAAVRLLPR